MQDNQNPNNPPVNPTEKPKKNYGLLIFLLLIALIVPISYFGIKSYDFSKITNKIDNIANSTSNSSGPKIPTGNDSKTNKSTGQKLSEMNKKVNPYTKIYNSYSKSVISSYNRYLSWVDEKTGPTGKEKYISYGIYSLYGDPANDIAALEKAKKSSPSLPKLEKAGDDYTTALKQLYPLLKTANEYYENEDYKDDSFAKGKEMHPKLMTAFNAFKKADTDLTTQMDAVEADLEEVRLKYLIDSEGKKTKWHAYNTLKYAKKMMALGNVADAFTIDSDKFQKAVSDYEKAIDDFDKYVTDNKVGSVSSLISDGKDLKIATKKLMRRVRDKTPYTTGDKMLLGDTSEWMVDGSPGKALSKYNDFIRDFNSVIQFNKF